MPCLSVRFNIYRRCGSALRGRAERRQTASEESEVPLVSTADGAATSSLESSQKAALSFSSATFFFKSFG